MNTNSFLTLLLAVALVILSAKTAFFSGDSESAPADSAKIVIDNIMTRTGIRAYQDKPVEDEKLELLLKAGMAAPSGLNTQSWGFVVVKKKELLQALADSLPNARMLANAPVAIVACGDMTTTPPIEGYWAQDVSAATENILLAAHGLGLGAVWTGVYLRPDRTRAVRNVLNMPEHLVPLSVIPIGYPAENPVPKDKWKPEKVYYDEWEKPKPV